RPDFPDILELVISANIIPIVSTKEFLSEATVSRLHEIGLTTIQLSIDSLIPEIADFLTGSNDYFSQISKTMDRLLKNNIKVTTNTVVTSYNFSHIPELVLFLVQKGVVTIHLSQYARSLYRHRDDLFLSKEDKIWLTNKINDIKDQHPECDIQFPRLLREFENPGEELQRHLSRPPCPAGKSSFVILPDGKVIPCEQLPSIPEFIIGDLNKQSIQEIWNSPALKEFIYPSKEAFMNTECGSCDEFEHCIFRLGRCIRETYKAYGNIYSVDPNCPKAFSPMRLF
ncbi:MAG: radical SAM protein, partial [bacterium]